MLLAIDIGNTNVKVVVFNGERERAAWRLATEAHRMPDEYELLLANLLSLGGVAPKDINAVVMCSVVPSMTAVFTEVCQEVFHTRPLVVGPGVRTGLRIVYDDPRSVGADRIVDAAAAYHLYGGPVIVVDCGTATVFDGVTASADFIGGAIAPGLRSAADALLGATSQLRGVELVAPASAIGRNNVQAIQSGLVFSHVDMVEGMVRRFKRELGEGAKVVGTGGFAGLVAHGSTVFDEVNSELTLLGLRWIYELNKPRGSGI
ncbi:MAG: type III pantothenate kinase [Chloroflexi bacterium]|nr:type III pantothenate kinase [Chloroflexota bacterium]